MKQMHKLLLPITVFILFAGQVYSQGKSNRQIPKKKIRCYTAENMQAFHQKNPSAPTEVDFENWLKPLINKYQKGVNGGVQNATPTSYKVPIVFHIIYNGELEGDSSNVSQASIIEEVLQLNKDYANLSNSKYAVAANTGIQFGLAAVDPSGNTLAEPGIDRQDITTNGWTSYGPPFNDAGQSTGNFWTVIKPATIWDPTKYVNVWVADIASGTAGIVGISTFPTIPSNITTVPGLTANETSQNAGIVVDYTTIGSVFAPNQNGLSNGQCGSNAYAMGKTATHELGHYFGLRHVWGDNQPSCGDDYCGDTPSSSEPNYGTPVHPEPDKVCGTIDQLFEDYMDYSDDHVMSTFTQNQVARMQTVMANSVNRSTLPNAVAMVDPVGTNQISFKECSGEIVVLESGTLGTYPRYRDTSILLNIDQVATDNTSTLTVTALPTSTAVAGVDYQIMNPSISFAAGDSYKAIQLRIFDNAYIDGDRYLDLGYTLTGTGVTAGTNAQTLRVAIVDDDNIKIGQNKTSLISQSFGTSGGALPTGWYAGASTSYPNSFVVGSVTSTGMTGQYAYVTNNATSKPNTYTKGGAFGYCFLEFLVNGLSVASLDTFSFTYKAGGVADNATTGAQGDVTELFQYNLHDTLGNIAGFGAAGTATTNTGYGPYVKQTTAKRLSLLPSYDMAYSKFVPGFYFITGSQTTGTNPGFNLDSVVLKATPFKVETTKSSSYGFDIPAYSTNIIRSTNTNAIVVFRDGATALKGLTASVVDTGVAKGTFTTSTSTFNRAKKIIKLAASAVNNTSSDSVTLYYTVPELAVWGQGKNIVGLKVIQVKDGTTYSNTTPLNTSNAYLLTTIVDTTRKITDGIYTIRVNTTHGLGTFLLVDSTATLPLISQQYVSGNIATPLGKKVNGASVTATGSGYFTTLTNTSGNFTDTLISGSNYTIRPYKNNDIKKANGVTSLDIALIQSHILGKTKLNSPYKILAADVNGDGKVNSLDIVYIKRLILGTDTTFTNGTTKQTRLWAFVDSAYKFQDTTNPFLPAPYLLKDSISYTGLSANKTNQSFIGIKLGDVNWDWNPANAKMPEAVFVKPKEVTIGQ